MPRIEPNIKKEGTANVRALDALKSVFLQHYTALCFFAEKLIKHKTEAEDIVETVFIKLWEKEPDFGKYKNVKALLYIAVKNACFDCLEKRRRNFSKQHDLTYTLQHETESFALLEIVRAEVLRELYAGLEKLPAECRRVMQLVYVEGWETKKVAEYLNITPSTVRTQKARGILALRKKINLPVLLFFTYIIFP